MLQEILAMPIWQKEFLANTMRDYTVALVVLVFLFIVLRIFLAAILRRLKAIADKTSNGLDDLVIEMLQSIKPGIYVYLSFWVATKVLILPDLANRLLDAVLIIWAVFVGVKASGVIIDYIARKQIERDGSAPMVGLLRQLFMGTLWLLGILLILSNLGVNITSLIAGLGIGGIAVALAVQNILGDLFSSFALYFDKPFEVGDMIEVGKTTGTVEKVGIKTTRLRSLSGEEIVVSNKELTTAKIHNYRKLQDRRVVFKLGIVYKTNQKRLESIPGMIQEIIEQQESARFDGCHLISLGESALIFQTVYYMTDKDFNLYRKTHQSILFAINEALHKAKIEVAHPTQTIVVEKA